MTTPTLDNTAVRKAYRRWAPVYDNTFGRVAAVGRRRAVSYINTRGGRVLEVGVGTGLSLPAYEPHLEIVGLDISPEMLVKARGRALRLDHVLGLVQMDAAALGFADGAFDTVVAMYVMTVVPDPAAVMRELARVCAPGGEVILVNHFSQEHGVRGWLEHKMAPLAETLGWHPVFETDQVMVCPELALQEQTPMWPMGLFSMLRFVKQADAAAPGQRA
jgi:phosphatidylethanolamine/phosphatidyl-N-methylethanolamine N-methyltransferase